MKNYTAYAFLTILTVFSSCKKDCLDECRDNLKSFTQVENTSFEDWIQSDNLVYEDPEPLDLWATLNPLTKKPADVKRAPVTVFKLSADDSTAYEGNGVKIVTGSFAPVAGIGPLATEGILALGQLNTERSDLYNPISYGQHLSRKVKAISGYYKYFPEKNDSALIQFKGFNYLSCSCNEQILFEENYVIKEKTEWTRFGINISKPYEGIADGVSIIFSSSGLPTDLKGAEGSTLYIDELEVEYFN